MKEIYKIFVLSPGSTSTKLAMFENEERIFYKNVSHNSEELSKFKEISDQLEYRANTIMEALKEENFTLEGTDAFASYSGNLVGIIGGIYPINENILHDAKYGPLKHPNTLGTAIIDQFAKQYGGVAMLVNPPDVDEFDEVARVTGLIDVVRESRLHALNHKEVAMRHAASLGKAYEECNFIVAHIGGGLSVAAHRKGMMVDSNDVMNGDGPMAPTRSGTLPVASVIKMCFSGKYTEKEMIARISKDGGLTDHLGTADVREIEKRISEGDTYAKLILDAMIYQTAKYICSCAGVLKGKVDGILLTGGISNDVYLVNKIKEYAEWVAPVTAYPGDFEMEALASGALRFLKGEEKPKNYTGIPVWSGFKK